MKVELIISKHAVTVCATHRFFDSGWPALVQHRTTLGVIDLKAQREADWTDVVCSVLSRGAEKCQKKSDPGYDSQVCVQKQVWVEKCTDE